jgi:hypothetical protein
MRDKGSWSYYVRRHKTEAIMAALKITIEAVNIQIAPRTRENPDILFGIRAVQEQ